MIILVCHERYHRHPCEIALHKLRRSYHHASLRVSPESSVDCALGEAETINNGNLPTRLAFILVPLPEHDSHLNHLTIEHHVYQFEKVHHHTYREI